MDVEKYERCWQSLAEDQRVEVLSIDGIVPDWFAARLDAFGIMVARVELPDGVQGSMLTTRFRDWLDDKR